MKKTHEKAKRYLRSIRKLDGNVNNELLELARLRALAEKINSHISEVKVQSSGSQSRLEDTVIKISEQEKKVSIAIDTMMARQEVIMSQIDGLENADSREILRMYFVEGVRFFDIHKNLNMSENTVYRYYEKGLIEFEKKYWDFL